MQPDKEDLKLRDEAIELADSGDTTRAEPVLRSYAKRYPDDLDALAWLALCVTPAEAVSIMDHILAQKPNAQYFRAMRAQYARLAASTPAPSSKSPEPISTNSAYPFAVPVPAEQPASRPAEPVVVQELPPPEAINDTASTLYPYTVFGNSTEPENDRPTTPAVAIAESVAENVTSAADSTPAALQNGASAATPLDIDNSPVSISELLPDFEALSDSAVIIPPPPPPAPPQVEPLPVLDPNDWLARAGSEARQNPEFTQEANQPLFGFIDFLNKLSWLDPARHPDGTFVEEADQRARYNQGLVLVRGSLGDYKKLAQAAQLFQQCRPPLCFAGACEALVSASYVHDRLYNPFGLVYAVFWADRALMLDPFNTDALVARSEATVRSRWRLLADITVDRLRLLAPTHPRRYAIDGWYEYLAGSPRRAAELLRLAIETALTPTEKELCTNMLNIVEPPVAQPTTSQ